MVHMSDVLLTLQTWHIPTGCLPTPTEWGAGVTEGMWRRACHFFICLTNKWTYFLKRDLKNAGMNGLTKRGTSPQSEFSQGVTKVMPLSLQINGLTHWKKKAGKINGLTQWGPPRSGAGEGVMEGKPFLLRLFPVHV